MRPYLLRQVFLIAAFSMASIVGAAPVANPQEKEVLQVEEAFRQAKLHNDVKALGQVLTDDFKGVNQWGARRDKAAVIELFGTFKTASLTNHDMTVRFSGDTAIVDGTMSETGPGGDFNRMIFSRV